MDETTDERAGGLRMLAPDTPLGHPGELEMRARFPSDYRWDDHSLAALMHPVIQPALARFIQSLPFFFLATANAEGHCDCSFRGQEHDATGAPLPVIRLVDERRLIFPEFPGNGLYNSMGNIQVNPHVGLLFIDFERRRRARINGVAQILGANDEIRAQWPGAQAAVLVTVEQSYGNCSTRIPQMRVVD